MTEFFDAGSAPVCEACDRRMTLIRGPVGHSPVWQPKVWFCEGCRAAVDVAPGALSQAAPVPVDALAPRACSACAVDDEIYPIPMAPVCGRLGADEQGRGGRWYLMHWYCPMCKRVETLTATELVEVAA